MMGQNSLTARRVVGLCVLVLGALLCPALETPAQLIISEVVFDPAGLDSGRQMLELRNVGKTEFAMGDGYWLFFAPSRWQFPSGVTVPAGETLVVHFGVGESSGSDFYTGLSGIRNLEREDAMGLFRTNLFSDPEEIVDFVQWGSAGNGGEDVANSAGLWTPLTYVDVAELREGSSLAHTGTGEGAEAWCIDGTPTLGAENDGCSTSFVSSSARLNEIGFVRDGVDSMHLAVEIKHFGDALEDLGGRWLNFSNGESYHIPLGSVIAPGEIFVIHFTNGVPEHPLEVYAGAQSNMSLKLPGAISIHAVLPVEDPTGVIDFAQWEAAGDVLEGAAATAGVWDAGTAIDGTGRRALGSFALVTAPVGAGVANWAVDNTATIGAENDVLPEVDVVINEVFPDPSGGVELKNIQTEFNVSLDRYTLCMESQQVKGGRACYTIPGSIVLAPGEIVVVRWNQEGENANGELFTGPMEELSGVAGALSLFVADGVEENNNLVDSMSWGGSTGAIVEQAVDVGIWPPGDTIDASELEPGSSIAYLGEGDDSASYRIDVSPSLGANNMEPLPQEPFQRGDCNDDGRIDISDAIKVFIFLFLGGERPTCPDACDANNDERNDVSDPVTILILLFQGSKIPLPPPSEGCGVEDAVDELPCRDFLSCADA